MPNADGGFTGRLRRNVAAHPDRAAVLFDSGPNSGPAGHPVRLSYLDLDRMASSVALDLRARYTPGERVIVPYPPVAGFVTGLLGCLYAGMVPVPVPAPGGLAGQARRTDGIVQDSGAVLVLTETAHMEELWSWIGDEPGQVKDFMVVPDAPDGDPEFEPLLADPDALVLLQYTSGSTSEPKGVMVSHANLVHNITTMSERQGWRPGDRFCSWAPAYHDLGLIAMLLAPLYLGGTAILMPAFDFFKRPVRWLELIDRYDAQVSCAPNFAYELCLRHVTDEQVAGLDLSRWRSAANGAEPINPYTLTEFAARFAPAGFRPETFWAGYGLAETTLYVSGTTPGNAPTQTTVDPVALAEHRFVPAHGGVPMVGCGRAGMDVRIVDPATRKELADGQVGEVWLRGPSVAMGYWHNPRATAEIFHATLDGTDGPYLRTGDLGVLHDSELYITGRIKEVLMVNGRNLYPHDIEREVRAADPAFAELPCCVFSVPSTGMTREEVVVVQELRARGRSEQDIKALAGKLRLTLSRQLNVQVANIVFVRLGRIRKTSSGKLQRGRMRELFLTNGLDALHEDLAPATRRRYRAGDRR